ncbi:MAG: cell division protein FtsN [Alphaproteobacteria bacterium ADurb.BinA280]|jgi:cell division protein FtsN|nr:SPOR domain-containing protein [Xanthomonadales bacterium]MCC6506236.1 SPOR domain-containing protein [Aquimonas sp.]OPZ11143.1 MAG: cell division protein FtsN [Alphaproteobacteria bacterium ADurb.BinA280]
MSNRRGKPKSQARRGSDRSVPGWIWLLAGLLLGLAASAYVLMREGSGDRPAGPQPDPRAQPAAPSEAAPSANAPAVADEEPKRQRYDFYTLLRDRETAIPDNELAASVKQDAAQPAAQPSAGERFLLQAGAFRSANDADALKARLALLGLIAQVQSDSIDGNVWYRVRLGPFADLREVESAKQQLSSNGIAAMAVREKTQ